MKKRGGGLALEMWRADGHLRALDVRLQELIWVELRARGVCPGALMVEVAGRVATLGGSVTSYAEKLAAGNAAARVAGLERIDDLIVVVPTPSNAWSDEALLPIVTNVLRWDSRVPPGRVTADVLDGHVILTGGVDKDADRAAAEAAISTLIGVRGVLNRITVPARPAGPQAKAAVLRSLARWLGRDGRRVRVVVRDAAIELHGRVASPAERRAAERAVRQVLGDVRLDCQLVIGGWPLGFR
ncbi:MAG TPA: BON domain-containing protein [Gemmatimonadales bacterium]|nr:BON domain-containing protein [Gemmatimonadales bacterium]